MLINPATASGTSYAGECVKDSRTLGLWVRYVYYTNSGAYTDVYGNKYDQQVYDISDLKSFEITDSVCGNAEYSVGNVPIATMKLTAFEPSDPGFFVPEDRTAGNPWFEVYFSPFDDDTLNKPYFMAINPGSKPNNYHALRIGVFYLKNAYWVDGIETVEAKNSLGLLIEEEFFSSLAYPSTVGAVLLEALGLANLFIYEQDEIDALLNASVPVAEAPVGSTCRSVIQDCLACMGANLVHENRYDIGDPLDPRYTALWDYFVRVVYPCGQTKHDLSTRTLENHIMSGYANDDMYTLPRGAIFELKNLKNRIVYEGVQYGDITVTGTGATPTGFFLSIPTNPYFSALGTAALNTALLNIANIYKGFSYNPTNMKTNSVPFFQGMDGVRFYDREGNVYRGFVTSTNMNGIATQTIVSAGNTVPTNSYSTSARNSVGGRQTQAQNVATLNDKVASLQSAVNTLVDNLTYRANEVAILSNLAGYGYIGQAVTSAIIAFPIPKNAHGRSVTITSLVGLMGGISGKIDGTDGSTEWVGRSGVTLSVSLVSNNLVRVIFTKTTGFKDPSNTNTPANTPIYLNIASVSLKFT